MNMIERQNVYFRQNGARKLTPKQRRRVIHKGNRNIRRMAISEGWATPK